MCGSDLSEDPGIDFHKVSRTYPTTLHGKLTDRQRKSSTSIQVSYSLQLCKQTVAATSQLCCSYRCAGLESDAQRRIALACLVSLVPRLITIGSPGSTFGGRTSGGDTAAAAGPGSGSGSGTAADGLVAGSVPSASDDVDANAWEGKPCGQSALFLDLMCAAMVRIT
jgi:hypothetical protein